MISGNETTTLSAHVRYPSREGVVEALLRLGIGHGGAQPVWPPHRLPFGLLVSPVRNGWVSLWSPLADVREWFPALTGTLECPGILFESIQSRFWIGEFFRHGELVGRMELPEEAVAYDNLWARAVESLEAEGIAEPWEDEARFTARLDEIAASDEYQEDLDALEAERLEPDALQPFLPPYASREQAWELLTAMDRAEAEAEEGEEPSEEAEDYLDRFASYLGLRDAAWNPAADAEALAEGDYEDEEGLPEGWREFVVCPSAACRCCRTGVLGC